MFWGAELVWPSNHFRLYTARCICTEAQEMRAPCMFDWQGTQTFFSHWNAKSKIRSLMCTLHNSKFTITSIVCTLRNSKCTFRIKIQIRTLPSCENSQSMNIQTHCIYWNNVWKSSRTRLFSPNVNVNSIRGLYNWAGLSKTTGVEHTEVICHSFRSREQSAQCPVLTLTAQIQPPDWTKLQMVVIQNIFTRKDNVNVVVLIRHTKPTHKMTFKFEILALLQYSRHTCSQIVSLFAIYTYMY